MTTHIFCPKCGYQRTAEDDPSIPQGKCPSCEVYYAKYISQQSAPKPEPRKQKKAEQPKAKIRTHYDNLKVARDVSTSDIQAAYDALVEAYHPGKHPDNKGSAEKVMKVIKEAYEVLIDPVKRVEYDAWIREQESEIEQQKSNTSTNNYGTWFFYAVIAVTLLIITVGVIKSIIIIVMLSFLWLIFDFFTSDSDARCERIKIKSNFLLWSILPLLFLVITINYLEYSRDKKLLENIANKWVSLKPTPLKKSTVHFDGSRVNKGLSVPSHIHESDDEFEAGYADTFFDTDSSAKKVIHDMSTMTKKLQLCKISRSNSYSDQCGIDLYNYAKNLLLNDRGNSVIYVYNHLSNKSINESNIDLVESTLHLWDSYVYEFNGSYYKSSSEDERVLWLSEENYTHTSSDYLNWNGKLIEYNTKTYTDIDVSKRVEKNASHRYYDIQRYLKSAKEISDLCLIDMNIGSDRLTNNCRKMLTTNAYSHDRLLMELYYGTMIHNEDTKGGDYRQFLWSYYRALNKLKSLKMPQSLAMKMLYNFK